MTATERDRLFTENFRLVRRITRRFAPRVPEHMHDDLDQWGAVGLLDAIRQYDPARGTKFSTVAYRRIRGEVIDGLRDTDHLSRDHRNDVKAGRVPPCAELPLVVDIIDHRQPSMIDEPLMTLWDAMAPALCFLTAQVRDVLRLHFVEGWTYQRIGDDIGLTRERIRQLINDGIRRIQDYYHRHPEKVPY